jgi:hypothetical protein
MTARRRGWIGRVGGLCLGAVLSIVVSAPAAAEVSEDVRRDVADLVEDLMLLYSGADLAHAGFSVEESGTGYRVTLNSVRLVTQAVRHPELGAVVLVLEPVQDGYRITGIEMPRSFPMKSVNGGPAGQVTVDEYSFTGLWQRTPGMLVESALHIGGFRFESWPEELTVEEAKAVTGLSPAGGGRWRETAELEFSEYRHTRHGPSVYMSGVELHLLADGIDLKKYEALQRLLDEVQEQDLTQGDVDPALLGELRNTENSVRGIQFELSVRDLLVEVRDLVLDTRNQEPVVVPSAEFSLSAEGLDGASARTDFQLKIDQADMPLAKYTGGGVPEALGPQSLELNVAIDALPWPALWEAFVDFLYAAAPGEESAWRLGLALQDAGTRLQLMPSRLSSEATTLTGNGEVRGEPAAAFGAVATFAFEIVGLSAAQAMAMDSPDGGLAMGVLGQLDAMGKPASGADGTSVHRYDIVLGADGVLTVNGEPFTFAEPGIEN